MDRVVDMLHPIVIRLLLLFGCEEWSCGTTACIDGFLAGSGEGSRASTPADHWDEPINFVEEETTYPEHPRQEVDLALLHGQRCQWRM